MRKVFSILLLLFCVAVRAQDLLYSQSAPVDSLKQALHTTTNDTLRMVLLNRIQNYYFGPNTNVDSALFYSKQFLPLTQKLHYEIDEAYAYDLIGTFMSYQLNAQTLATLFKGIRIAEDPSSERHVLPKRYLKMMVYWGNVLSDLLNKNDWNRTMYRKLILASLYNDLALAYGSTISNQQKLLSYSYKAISIFEAYKDSFDLGVMYNGMADYFSTINQYDSCLYYAQKSNALQTFDSSVFIALNLGLIGTMHFRKGNVEQALPFLRRSIQFSLKYHLPEYWLPDYTLAQYHFERGANDSSLYYLKKALNEAMVVNLPADVQKASALLAKVYKTVGKLDSATKYYEMALSYNDIINNIDKKRALQSQDFDEQLRQQQVTETKNKIKTYWLLTGLGILLLIAGVLLINIRRRKRINTLLQQKNQQIENTLTELKATQAQLIQSEKMASLGELTAGIAHEIQNPLNFVNNFSETNNELLAEMKEEMDKGNVQEVRALADDVIENNTKINHHGRRADSIVKAMLEHSRTSKGEKQPTDVNSLVDEYLRLAYHGMRAKDKSFESKTETYFDESIGKVNIVPQDIGRVLLNLFNNAFYAVHECLKKLAGDYKPTVSVSTRKMGDAVEIVVKDNGMGISKSIQDKIFQPFFTTKPTGQGTGLGLSLSYDIVKAHGGELQVVSKDGEGAQFRIILPDKIDRQTSI